MATTHEKDEKAKEPAPTGTTGTTALLEPALIAPEESKVRQWDDDDYVCFVRRHWGTPNIPPGKKDYVDKYTFIGGVARNVRYADASKWLKPRIGIGGYILDNDATVKDIEAATGRSLETPENIATALSMLTAEKLMAILGPEAAKQLGREILAGPGKEEGR